VLRASFQKYSANIAARVRNPAREKVRTIAAVMSGRIPASITRARALRARKSAATENGRSRLSVRARSLGFSVSGAL